MLNESSLTRLFTNLYDSTIVDVQSRMDTLHKKLEDDHESFVRDYTLISSDYDSMHQQIKAQYSEIASLKEEVESLKTQLSSAQSLLRELRKRLGSLLFLKGRSLIDGTDRIDYAYEKNGGRVMTGWKWLFALKSIVGGLQSLRRTRDCTPILRWRSMLIPLHQY